jgi:type II secretory pathway pseudopilin PulG
MRATERRRERGFLLGYVLIVVAILAIVSMMLLESAQNGATNARQIEVKNDSFDAAEAGLNAALEALDLSLSQSTSRSATLANGFHYRYHIHPNFSGQLPISIDDPGETSEGGDQKGDDGGGGGGSGSGGSGSGGSGSGGSGSGGSGSGGSGSDGGGGGRGSGDKITLPPGGAVIVSVGAGPNGERVTTLEAAVTADVAQLTYPQYAIIAGLNIQGKYFAALTMPPSGGGVGGAGGGSGGGTGGASGGSPLAGIHANGTITARASSRFQATAEASGKTNTLPPHTNRVAQVPLPMVSQFDYMVASYKNQASSGGGFGNVFLPQDSPLQSTYDCSSQSLGQSCLLYYDGRLDLESQLTSFTGQWTMVVNGNLTLANGAALIFHDRPALLIVNGDAYISGTGPTAAYLQVKGSTSLSGNAQFTGAIMSLGSLTFQDGSTGGFTFDPTVIPPGRAMVGLVKIISYAEY